MLDFLLKQFALKEKQNFKKCVFVFLCCHKQNHAVCFHYMLSLPFELVFFVPDVVSLIVAEEYGDACRQVAVDAVHVAGCSHDGAHVFVAVLDALLHLNADKHTPHS